MATRTAFLLASVLLPLLAHVACSSDPATTGSATGATAPASDAAIPDQVPAPGTAPAASDAGSDARASSPKKTVAPLERNDAGCVTFQAAAKFCGTASDDAICTFAVGCGVAKDMSQCVINCEMQTTVQCLDMDDAQCLADAVASDSCDALAACAWSL